MVGTACMAFKSSNNSETENSGFHVIFVIFKDSKGWARLHMLHIVITNLNKPIVEVFIHFAFDGQWKTTIVVKTFL